MDQLYTFLSIILVPLSASIFLYLYKSKCSNVKLCYGLMEVERDVIDEVKSDMAANETINRVSIASV